jgi:hypothetical protein
MTGRAASRSFLAWNGAGARLDLSGATVIHSGWSDWYGPGPAPDDRDPERRAGDQPMGGARFEIGPGQGLPFLISTQGPGRVQADSALAMKGGLIIAALRAGPAVFVLVLRLG